MDMRKRGESIAIIGQHFSQLTRKHPQFAMSPKWITQSSFCDLKISREIYFFRASLQSVGKLRCSFNRNNHWIQNCVWSNMENLMDFNIRIGRDNPFNRTRLVDEEEDPLTTAVNATSQNQDLPQSLEEETTNVCPNSNPLAQEIEKFQNGEPPSTQIVRQVSESGVHILNGTMSNRHKRKSNQEVASTTEEEQLICISIKMSIPLTCVLFCGLVVVWSIPNVWELLHHPKILFHLWPARM